MRNLTKASGVGVTVHISQEESRRMQTRSDASNVTSRGCGVAEARLSPRLLTAAGMRLARPRMVQPRSHHCSSCPLRGELSELPRAAGLGRQSHRDLSSCL